MHVVCVTTGGACGYQNLAGTPYTASIAAGSGAIFQNGMGCGQCYDVRPHRSTLTSSHVIDN